MFIKQSIFSRIRKKTNTENNYSLSNNMRSNDNTRIPKPLLMHHFGVKFKKISHLIRAAQYRNQEKRPSGQDFLRTRKRDYGTYDYS